MQAGSILFNTFDFSTIGKASLRIARQPDPPAPASPTRHLVTLIVVVRLDAHDPATIQARLRHLQQTVTIREGILMSQSGRGHTLSWMARPSGDSLAQAITGRTNHVELTFSAVETLATETVGSFEKATFTPIGGSPIHLHSLSSWDKSVSTERVSLLSSARTLSTTTISFAGLYAQANPVDTESDRHAILQAASTQIEDMDCRYGTLTVGGWSHKVRVRSLRPIIDEARSTVEVAVECFYTDIPGDSDAIVEINESVNEDAGSGERVFSYSGTITADDEAIAIAHFDALVAAKEKPGRRLTSIDFRPNRIEGGDASSEEWTGSMPFGFEYRLPQDSVTAFSASTTNSEDESGRNIRITGQVRGQSIPALEAKVANIVATFASGRKNKSETTIDYETPVGGTSAMVVVMKFSYDYRSASVNIIGTIEHSTSRPDFGDHSASLQGRLAAPTFDQAVTAARSLLPANIFLQTQQEDETEQVSLDNPTSTPTVLAAHRQFLGLRFSYSWRTAHSQLRIRYSDQTRVDESTMTSERTIDGTAWASTLPTAASGRDALLAGLSLTKPTRTSDTSEQEHGPLGGSTTTRWVSLRFTRTYVGAIDGTPGNDIIEASVSVQRTGSINRPIVHEIPYSRPIAQIDTGWTPGRLVVSARCKARLAQTARAWVQGHSNMGSLLGTIGTNVFQTESPQENMDFAFIPFDGSTIRVREFSGRYTWTVTQATSTMDGIWPGSLASQMDSAAAGAPVP